MSPDIMDTSVSQVEMMIRILRLVQVISFVLIVIGGIIGVLYLLKSKSKHKTVIGVTIIMIPIVIHIILRIVEIFFLLPLGK